MSDGATLVTGATGFLGSALVAALLERGGRDVVALVRAGGHAAAEARLDGALAGVYGAGPVPGRARVRALAADVAQPRLGLTPAAYDALAADVAAVVHCAAAIRFDLPLPEARAINVDGTARILDLVARSAALRGVPPRAVHVSTAFVSGTRPGPFGEDELDVEAPFRNTYERTKAEAEAAIGGSGLRVAIARPSIVVGETHSGWTTAFNVLYPPLRAYARGLLDVIPADPDGIVDAIGVDAVVSGLLALHDDPSANGTHTFAAGPAAVTVRELATAAARELGRPAPRFAGTDLGAVVGDVYVPYLGVRTRFSVERGHALLRRAGVAVQPVTEHLDTLLGYARAARWGKTAVPRAHARALAVR